MSEGPAPVRQGLAPGPSIASPRERRDAESSFVPERVLAAGILTLSALLNLYRLGDHGYPNVYYAATVRSMVNGWHNAFFAAFDPGGFVSVDKPPLGFWVQALTARFLGFHPLSLLLPQALAGVAAVWLLYLLVGRTFGRPAGLVAALVLAVTPISVATNRNNTPDSLLVVLLLAAVWAVVLAVERGKLRWLLLGSGLVGLAFNVKMSQAFLIVPALALYFLLSTSMSGRRRILAVTAAAVLLAGTSFAWMLTVDAIPASDRPYVGSSHTNSEIELAANYNGVQRVTGSFVGTQTAAFAGRGPLRLFRFEERSQFSWLLPLALGGLVVAALARRRTPQWQQGVLLWGVWLLTGYAFSAVTGYFHPYYLATIAPALAAMIGIGLITMWDTRSHLPARKLWLVAGAGATILFQIYILRDYTAWLVWLAPALIILSLVGLALLLSPHRPVRSPLGRFGGSGKGIFVLGLCLAPAVWSAIVPWEGSAPGLPYAGPRSAVRGDVPGSSPLSHETALLTTYLLRHAGNARYLAGGVYADTVAPIIVRSDRPALALGGFRGSDPILSVATLVSMVHRGEVRLFLLERAWRLTSHGHAPAWSGQPALVTWIWLHCALLHPPGLSRLIDSYDQPNDLYRCGG